jgi:hypothetical protein
MYWVRDLNENSELMLYAALPFVIKLLKSNWENCYHKLVERMMQLLFIFLMSSMSLSISEKHDTEQTA